MREQIEALTTVLDAAELHRQNDRWWQPVQGAAYFEANLGRDANRRKLGDAIHTVREWSALLAVPVPHQEEHEEKAEDVDRRDDRGGTASDRGRADGLRGGTGVRARAVAAVADEDRALDTRDSSEGAHAPGQSLQTDGQPTVSAVPTGEGLRAEIDALFAEYWRIRSCSPATPWCAEPTYGNLDHYDGHSEAKDAIIDQLMTLTAAALTSSPDPTPGEPT